MERLTRHPMNKPVATLLTLSTIDRIILQGIYPILPVLIANLGIPPGKTGLFMTVTYVAIALGSIITPALLRFYPRVSKLSVAIAVATAVTLGAMGLQTTFGGLLAATAGYWFLCGIQINIYSIIMSHISPAAASGTNFGLLANTTLVGSVVGSFGIGPAIHYLGSSTAFWAFGLLTCLSRLLLIGSTYEVVYAQQPQVPGFRPSSKLWVLVLALNAGIMLSFIGRFNLSLIMQGQQQPLGAISYVFGVGSLLALPLPWLFGRLSHKIPPKALLLVTLASVTGGMYLLYSYSSYGSFIAVSFLIAIMTYCSRGVSQKIVYDLYPLGQQTQAQSLLTSANWMAAIAGFVLVGTLSGTYALQQVSLYGFWVGCATICLLALWKLNR